MNGGKMVTRNASRLPHIECPHCGAKAFARTAGKTDNLYREVYYRCRDEMACGHTFVVGMAILRTLQPSMRPNPAIRLPFSQFVRTPANDIAPEPANDDGEAPPPAAAELME